MWIVGTTMAGEGSSCPSLRIALRAFNLQGETGWTFNGEPSPQKEVTRTEREQDLHCKHGVHVHYKNHGTEMEKVWALVSTSG